MKRRFYKLVTITSLVAFLAALVIPAHATRTDGNKSFSKESPKRKVASS